MPIEIAWTVAVVLVLVVILAGAINGVAGFGFAVVGTMTLATVIDPATAVVMMILPILSVNISLVRDLGPAELRACSRRFSPLIVGALVGTILGMVALGQVPGALLRVVLGIVALGFVASVQPLVPLPGLARTREACFVETRRAMLGVGTASGLLFGGTNVGVQLVAYVRSCDLSHGVFVGVVAMIFLGLNAIRVGAAGALGLYPDAAVLGLSVLAMVPAVIGVALGKRVRDRVRESHRQFVVLGHLTEFSSARLVLQAAVERLPPHRVFSLSAPWVHVTDIVPDGASFKRKSGSKPGEVPGCAGSTPSSSFPGLVRTRNC